MIVRFKQPILGALLHRLLEETIQIDINRAFREHVNRYENKIASERCAMRFEPA